MQVNRLKLFTVSLSFMSLCFFAGGFPSWSFFTSCGLARTRCWRSRAVFFCFCWSWSCVAWFPLPLPLAPPRDCPLPLPRTLPAGRFATAPESDDASALSNLRKPCSPPQNFLCLARSINPPQMSLIDSMLDCRGLRNFRRVSTVFPGRRALDRSDGCFWKNFSFFQ